MLKTLFEEQKKHLHHFFEHVDLETTETLLRLFAACQGLLIFTGVGKSGLVAEKIAVTMTSTGTRALYLSPLNALHGDLGMVSEKDVFVILSKSGESDELFPLLPALREKNVKSVALVSNPQSRLAKACDYAATLPLLRELCPFDMAPTTSTCIQMIYGDVLAVALMQLKSFSLEEYAQNHPAGRIGKRITTRVRDLMLTGDQTPLCQKEDKLVDTLVELSNKRCGCVLVIDGEKNLEGIFTDGDLRRALQKYGAETLNYSMEKLMVRHPRWTTPSQLAWEAMQIMEQDPKGAITALPVLEDGKRVKGLLRLHDIIQSGL